MSLSKSNLMPEFPSRRKVDLPSFENDPGSVILFLFAELRECRDDILDGFGEVEHNDSASSMLEARLKKSMNACIAICERDIRLNDTLIGSHEAILGRIGACKRELRILAARSVAKI